MTLIPANFSNVGLALPGVAGSWQTENKGHQFWTQSDAKGNFLIRNVLPGTYNLYAWVPGFIGDYKYEYNVIIKPGSNIRLGNVVYVPPRNGPILWEIGTPDRTAAEFFFFFPGLLLLLKIDYTIRFLEKGLGNMDYGIVILIYILLKI